MLEWLNSIPQQTVLVIIGLGLLGYYLGRVIDAVGGRIFPPLGKRTLRGLQTVNESGRSRDRAFRQLIEGNAVRHLALGLREARTRSRANELLLVGFVLLWLSGVLTADYPLRPTPFQWFALLVGPVLLGQGVQRRFRARREYRAIEGNERSFYAAHRLGPHAVLPEELVGKPAVAVKDMTLSTRPAPTGEQYLGY